MARALQLEALQLEEEVVKDHGQLAKELSAQADWVNGRRYYHHIVGKCRQAAKRGEKMVVVDGMDNETRSWLYGQGFSIHETDKHNAFIVSFI